MKRTSVSIGVLAACVLMAASGYAEPGQGKGNENGRGQGPRKDRPKTPAERFARLDADSSGGVTFEEFKTAHEARRAAREERRGDRPRQDDDWTPPPAEEIFSRMDADGDGTVTEAEFVADAEARRAERGRKDHGAPPPPPPPEESPED